MGGHPENVAVLAIRANDDPALLLQQARNLVTSLERGSGVLVMSDMFGATPSNIARRLLEPGKVEGLAGANLPMLVRALTYRNQPLSQVAEKAMSGCIAGALRMEKEEC